MRNIDERTAIVRRRKTEWHGRPSNHARALSWQPRWQRVLADGIPSANPTSTFRPLDCAERRTRRSLRATSRLANKNLQIACAVGGRFDREISRPPLAKEGASLP